VWWTSKSSSTRRWGRAPAVNDLNHDGKVNAADVQKAINAARRIPKALLGGNGITRTFV
jgi:hypothetical protein